VQVMSATMLREGDCAVIISNSGRSRDLLDVAEIARRKGATVIAITASGSPLAREAMQGGARHILLAADHPEDADRYSPMVSRLLHLLIIDILTTGVALRLGSARLKPMLAEIKRNLRQRRYAVPESAVEEAGGLDGGAVAPRPSSSATP
jgi:RpiR family carbohydrate utilization transcriptional regulator